MFNKIKILFDSIKGFRKQFCFILLLNIISPALEGFSAGLITPSLQGLINNQIDTQNPFFKVNALIFGEGTGFDFMILEILVLMLLSTLIAYASGSYERFCEEYVKQTWKNKIYNNYIRQPYSFFINRKQGELINNVVHQTDNGFSAIAVTMEFIAYLFTGIALVAVLFLTSFKLTAYMTLACLLIFFVAKKTLFAYSENTGRRRIKFLNELSSQVAETINGILQVKLFSLQKSFIRKFSVTSQQLAKMMGFYYMFRLMPIYGIKILLFIAGAGVVALNMTFHFFDFKLILPLASTFFIISSRLFDVLSKVMNDQINIINFFPSLELVNSLLKDAETNTPATARKADAGKIVGFEKAIEFKEVNFAYDGKIVFDSLNLKIPCFRKVGILGLSGSGKTTLVYLLMGIYTPAGGSIEFDGVPMEQIEQTYLQNSIGVVSQDNFIFSGTLRENIAIGLEGASEEEIIDAAKKANAHDFIVELKDGYDTYIGEKGLKLSGGQRQRLAIARTILRRPRVYIFDEATNSLDKESEGLIMETVEAIAREKTVIIISHDFTITNTCDRIFFLKDGLVKEEGTHLELLKNKKDYWELYTNLAKRV